MFSGGRDSTCLLDLAVRIAGADAVSALHVNYGLRGGRRRRRAPLRRASASDLGVPLDVRRPRRAARRRGRQPPGLGPRRALPRRRRAGRWRATRDVAAGHTATDQVETILYRLASSPSRRALLGMRPRERHALIRPLLEFTREQTAAYCRERGPALARGRDQRLRRLRPQPDPPRSSCRRCERDPSRRPRRTCWRWPRSCATRPTVLDELVDEVLDGAARDRAGRACASCRRRCAGSSSSGWPTGGRAARRRGRAARRRGRGAGRAGTPRSTCPPACGPRVPRRGRCSFGRTAASRRAQRVRAATAQRSTAAT